MGTSLSVSLTRVELPTLSSFVFVLVRFFFLTVECRRLDKDKHDRHRRRRRGVV
jgi:hypothetical protein